MNTSSQKISLSAMDYVLVTVGDVATSTADGVMPNRALSSFGTVVLTGGNLSTNSRQSVRKAVALPADDTSTRHAAYSVQVGTVSSGLPAGWLQGGAHITAGTVDLNARVSMSGVGRHMQVRLTTTANSAIYG